jgi:pimeloyl-CoA dehydrogenase small subunit
MDFDLSEEQRMLKEGVDRLLEDRYSFEQRKTYTKAADGWSRELWQQYADMGLLGVPFSQDHGGFGGGPVETMIVMEAFGKALILEPYFATVILFGGAVRIAGSDAQKAALLPKIAEGKLLGAFAHSERNSRYDLADVQTTAKKDGSGWVLDGEKTVVIHGDCADKLVVSARVSGGQRDKDGIALFIVDAKAPGVTRKTYPTQDSLRAADITLKGVKVTAADQLGEAGKGYAIVERVAQSAIQALSAEAVGGMQQMLDITVDYLKTRQQFGVPIGSFQALQHRAVDMLVATEQARSMAMYAAMMVDDADEVERSKAINAVKVHIGKSGRYVGQQSIQLHGGIGMTLEYKVGHYFIRSTMIEILFGDTDHHLAALARAGGLIAPGTTA